MGNKPRSIWDWVILCCIFFSAIASLSTDSMNSLALYVALPIAFAVSFIRCRKIIINDYQRRLLLLYIWLLISITWAAYPDLTLRECHQVLGAYLLSYIVAVNANWKQMVPWLYCVYLVLYLGAWRYASSAMLIVTDFSEFERLNNEKLNANTMAFYTFYVSFASFILSEILTRAFWKKLFIGVFFAMIPISIFVALSTASREVLLIQIPLFALLLWAKYIQSRRLLTKILFVLSGVVILLISIPKVSSVFHDSYLGERSSRSIMEDGRITLIKESIQVGIEHFPMGVGAGNFMMYSRSRRFSHNSFGELFADVGIVGFFLYTLIVFSFIFRQWKRYSRTKNKLFLYFFIFGIIYLIDQAFYVFYVDLWLISFFILIASHSEYCYRNLYEKQP